MLPLYLNLILPKAAIISSFLYFILFFLILVVFTDYKNVSGKLLLFFIVYLIFLLSLVVISALSNEASLFFSDLSEVFRIIFISTAFVYGLSKYDKVGPKSISVFITFFLISQTLISIPQALNIESVVSVSSIIWSSDKVTTGRIVGTMSNPNFLGILASSLAVYIIMKITLAKKIAKVDLFQLLILFIIIIFSGSRTSLLSFSLAAMLIFIINLRVHILKLIIPLFIVTLFGSDIYEFILNYEGLRYISEPFRLYEKNKIFSLSDINALSARLDIWERARLLFINSANPFKFVLGLGPGKEIGLSFMDNQYLFWFFKYGVLGCILFSIPPLISIYISLKFLLDKSNIGVDVAVLCIAFAVVFFINGLFAETFSSMMVSPLFYFIFGTLLGRFYNDYNVPIEKRK